MKRTWFRMIMLILVFYICEIYSLNSINAQELSCERREFVTEYPRVDTRLWCIEHFLPTSSEMNYSSLAYSNHVLYATHPMLGQVVAIEDTDQDGFPDTETVIVEGLQYPNGLSFYQDRLYILANQTVSVYSADGLQTIIRDLPTGNGFMPRAILVHEERILIGIPFPCDFCESDNNLHGTIISFSLSGTDPQIVARGLRYPAALAFFNDSIWVSDSAADRLQRASFFDEINGFSLDNPLVPDFGFPYCIDTTNTEEFSGDFDCTEAVAPIISIETGAQVLSIRPYTGEAFPWLQDKLLITMGGSFDNSLIHGYAVAAVDAETYDMILPADPSIASVAVRRLERGLSTAGASALVNQRGAGPWPHRVYDTLVNEAGFIFISVAGEGLYALTPSPNTSAVCPEGYREC